MFLVKNPQDFGAGVIIACTGIAGLVLGRTLPFGSLQVIGPGFFPIVVSALLAMLGAIISGKSLAVTGPSVEPINLRSTITALAGVCSFAFTIPHLGLVISTMLLLIVVSYSRKGAKFGETLLLAALITAAVVVIFVFGLRLRIPLWWSL